METEKVRRLLWLDLETTGLDKTTLSVLEVGWLVTDEALNQITSVESRVVGDIPAIDKMDDFVTKMHQESGLIEDVMISTWTLEDVQRDVLRTMREVEHIAQQPLPRGQERAMPVVEWSLAGSGVAQYDHPLLAIHMPEVFAKLTYFSYDIGILRRILRGCMELDLREQHDDIKACQNGNHRAAADITGAWAEAWVYKLALNSAYLSWPDAVSERIDEAWTPE
jgi:oligoribonuclease